MTFSKILQGVTAIAIVSGSFAVSPVPVFAQSDTAEAAKQRINLAGRQRMFTQKMAKDFCLVDAGVDVEASRADLVETRQYFNATLDALMVGFAGTVVSPPNAEIADKLQEVKDLWQGPDAVLAAVADGAAVSDADRRTIVDGIEKVLVAMNEAVNLYEKVTELP